MKKMLAFVLSLLLALSGISVFADSKVSSSMEAALLNVKQRVDIPAELTEFSSSVREVGAKTYYSFTWEDIKRESSLSVRCDNMGRISNFNEYNSSRQEEALFSDITKDEVLSFADKFMRKLAPEAFANSNDCLVADTASLNASGSLNYYINYDRYRDGIKVKNANSSVSVYIADDKLYVRSASINFEYDARFQSEKSELDDVEAAYFTKFPVELIYRNEYDYKIMTNGEPQKEILMLYRIKDGNAGYISAIDGEVVEEEMSLYGDMESSKNESASDSIAGGGSGGAQLTDKEIAELESIEGLISKNEVEGILKKLPSVDFGSDMQINNFRIFSDTDGNYYIRASYTNNKEKDYRSVNVKLEARDGKLTYLSNYQSYPDANTAGTAQKNKAEADINEFILRVCPDEFKECLEQKSEWYNNTLAKSYDRYVNDIRYVDNGVYISYDAYLGRVANYELRFDKDAKFASSDGIIGDEAARMAVLKNSPVEKLYIKNGGKYKLCYALSDPYIEIDSKTGEKIAKDYEKESNGYKYSDMDNHWAKEPVEKLAGINIGLKGDKFNPDSEITQRELLALFGAGVYYNSYLNYDDETLYRRLIDNNILTEADRAPDSSVKREDAFCYMVRMVELEKIAKAEEIFKVSYADGATLSKGKLGYAAVLTGLKVLAGDGGNIRANDNITRAEAATMLYKYMLNK